MHVSWTFGVLSVAFTVSCALPVRYVTEVIVMVSTTGFTVTSTEALGETSPEAELVAVTVNVYVCGLVKAGTLVLKVCCAPLVPATGVSVMPCGATQV